MVLVAHGGADEVVDDDDDEEEVELLEVGLLEEEDEDDVEELLEEEELHKSSKHSNAPNLRSTARSPKPCCRISRLRSCSTASGQSACGYPRVVHWSVFECQSRMVLSEGAWCLVLSREPGWRLNLTGKDGRRDRSRTP